MTKEEKPIEVVEQVSSVVPPSPTFEMSADQPLGPGLETLQKQVEVLTKELRGIQGNKDRTDKRVDDLNTQIGRILELSKGGSDENQIRRELLLDRILETGALPIQPVGGTTNVGTGSTESQFNIIEELNQLGLSTNDADVIAASGAKYRNADHCRAELAKLALRKTKSSTSSDTVVPPPTGSVITHPNEKALVAQLAQLQKDPVKNKIKIGEIEKALGW